jgi:geranylgeranyl reductase family protein
MTQTFDVIVIGGGPAGATAAMYLKRGGAKVLLLDKAASWPRDKICGDAQGRKAANIMKELGIHADYEKLPGQKIYGITLSSPNGTQISVDVEDRKNPAPGYCHKRMVFDDFLFQSAKRKFGVETRLFEVTDILAENGQVKGVAGKNEKGEKEEIRAKLVLAADGATSVLVRKFGLNMNPPEHLISAIRAYYKGITGMTDRIEIHLVKSLIPGYFWIFPLPNGEANVGLGMIVKDMNDKKINLKAALLKEIEQNPLFKERFKDAKLVDPVRGWSLPISSYHRKCFGDGWLALGDAASLIDPLSGEGVGTGMISGRIAALVALEALQKGDFSEKFLKKYDKLLWETIGDEVKANYRMQRIGKRFPHLIDKLMEKAAKDESFRKKFEKLLPYTGGRKEIGGESFLAELGHSEKIKEEELPA